MMKKNGKSKPAADPRVLRRRALLNNVSLSDQDLLSANRIDRIVNAAIGSVRCSSTPTELARAATIVASGLILEHEECDVFIACARTAEIQCGNQVDLFRDQVVQQLQQLEANEETIDAFNRSFEKPTLNLKGVYLSPERGKVATNDTARNYWSQMAL